MIDSVAGMISAPPMPMNARLAMSWFGRPGERREHGAEPEHDEPGLQRGAAPVLVADAAHREEQPGEHERVGVDHPLQLAVRGASAGVTMLGSATLRIELSSTITRRLKHRTPRISHRRSSARRCARSARLLRHGDPSEFRGVGADGARQFRNARVPICPTVPTRTGPAEHDVRHGPGGAGGSASGGGDGLERRLDGGGRGVGERRPHVGGGDEPLGVRARP